MGLKTPPHVKNYEQAEVRKYMQVKRSERHKIRKEQQVQLEQEKIKREERLRVSSPLYGMCDSLVPHTL